MEYLFLGIFLVMVVMPIANMLIDYLSEFVEAKKAKQTQKIMEISKIVNDIQNNINCVHDEGNAIGFCAPQKEYYYDEDFDDEEDCKKNKIGF